MGFEPTGIRNDLPTEFLPKPNRDVNHYATEHLYVDSWYFHIPVKHTRASFLTFDILDIS